MTKISATALKAQDILRRFRQVKPPIDVENIVERLGITVRRGDMGETSGVIYRDGEHTVIGINSTQSPERRRFTLAHELGHFLMHGDKVLWVDSSIMFRGAAVPGDPRETEANQFAADLLMPAEMLTEEHVDFGRIPDAVNRLAKKYAVSIPAMNYRLANLGLIPLF